MFNLALRDGMIIIYDGVCNFCNGWVHFVAKRDPKGLFSFAPAQSPFGAQMMSRFGYDPEELETIVLVDRDRCSDKSDAVLKILSNLTPWCQALSVLRLIPRSIRDFCYTQFANNRYALFGKSCSCRLPPIEWRDRLLG